MPTAEEFRKVMSCFATGVTLVTGTDEAGRPVGFTANSVASVSLDPLLVLFCADSASRSLPALLRTGRFRMSILGAGDLALARRFSEVTLARRFDGDMVLPAGGLPAPAHALAWLECDVWKNVPAGDHVIVIGEVASCGAISGDDPLVFYQGDFIALEDLRPSS